ncbi:pentapeptide repeat-containing protein [Corynebacterium sp. ACRPQ]|uniref:pentapeptide repeat-containing protein n=1 Tax=Corynebacterium sp. ACRPQ TaxID=2918201 RepID=UPI001EF1BAB6|nr:pentapeptide repeat-containing protein [Corynebacterium sp. ACRPQ]MCG7442151.1 pentapeptide repeat-containing protein [Corynebacterium sp. ACRPQ]
MSYGKNTPSEENTPKDASPKEQDAPDRNPSIESHTEQEKEVTQSTSSASPARSEWLRNFWREITNKLRDFWRGIPNKQGLRDVGISVLASIVVGSSLAWAQITDSRTQADTAIRAANTQAATAERLENLRYVRDRAQVATSANLSPHCLTADGTIFTPGTPTTKSSTDKPDPSIPELPFKDFDLKEQNLSGLWLNCANFSGANLEGADLSNAVLIEAKFDGANLRNANLQGAILELAQLGGADLRGADLSNADLSGTPTDLSILETATLHETILPEDNLALTPQQKQRLQDLGATFTKEEDPEP